MRKSINFFFRTLCALVYIVFLSTAGAFSNQAFANELITNTATATFTIDQQTQFISDSVQFTKDTIVIPDDVISLSKTADTTDSFIGSTVTYTLIVNNPNNHALTNVEIRDTLPTGLKYIADTAKLNGNLIGSNEIDYAINQLNIGLGNIPANTSWTLSYEALVKSTGTLINKATVVSDTATSIQAQVIVNIKERTPSAIKFLKINDTGNNLVIRPTLYLIPSPSNIGAKHVKANSIQLANGIFSNKVDSIILPNGINVSLPTAIPLIDASQYTLSDAIVIEVRDLDQNTNPTQINTAIVKIRISGTSDQETLQLEETSVNSGIFRGLILTTTNNIEIHNGLLSLKEGSKISVDYSDGEDEEDISVTAALIIPNTDLQLNKTSDKNTATIGELIKYNLVFSNFSNFNIPALPGLKVKDTLPLGFKYLEGSATLNGANVNNSLTIVDRNLEFKFGAMAVGETWTLEYLAKVGVGTPIGKAINSAFMDSPLGVSNTSLATVTIEDDLMRSKNILTGRVYVGCKTGKGSNVLKDARIFTETGRSVLSDKDGFWHMENIRTGTHLLQLDTISLSDRYEPIICKNNTRHAGNAKSQFVNLIAGSLWHVNFHVQEVSGSQQPINSKNTEKSLIEHNPLKIYDQEYLETAKEGFEILWPKNNYTPSIASTKIIVKKSPHQKIEVIWNGKPVDPLNYDGSITNKARTISIKKWVGVDLNLKNRDNTLLVISRDKSGNELSRKTHNVHFSGEPASAEFLPGESVLIADGKTIPVIALQIKDEDGYPMRANTHGYFTLGDNRFQIKTQNDNEGELNLNETIGGLYKYSIKENGIAKIELNPTSQSGEINLRIKFSGSKNKDIKAWIKPKLREWIMVGLAEGSVAYNTLSGNMQSLEDLGKTEKFTSKGRVAFFAKGKIQGKYLLTLAYDSHKEKQEIGALLNGNINPDAFYTLYGDNSNNQYNAQSSRKLYVKIEKDNFYAIFGDYQTNLSTTKLATYERVLNGIKSEFKGEQFSYNAFISETSNNHHHEKIPGDGTSGLYHVSSDIVPNSERVKIETYDRFHPEVVINSLTLTRYQDYDIDYASRSLFFKFPITGRDGGFNPQLIVIDYDSESDSNKEIVAGGRAAIKTMDKRLEVGVTTVYVGRNNLENESLIAIDATYDIQPSKNTKLHIEVAQTKTEHSQNKGVNSQSIELVKQGEKITARAYYRKEGEKFGLNSPSVNTIEKVGAEIQVKINDSINFEAKASDQINHSNNNKRQLAEIGVSLNEQQLQVNTGLRHSKENLDGTNITSDLAIMGAQYTTKSGRVTLRANLEENLNSSSDEERSPNRKVIGADLNITEGMSLFAEHELSDTQSLQTQNTRIGVTQSLWTGAKAKTTYTKERTDKRQRDYATLGLSQRIHIGKHLNADISFDQAKTISGAQKQFNNDDPAVQGSQTDDYSALSLGMGSHIGPWSWTGRFELRNGDLTDKTNLRVGFMHRLKDGKEVSVKYDYNNSVQTTGAKETKSKISLGSAWHPKDDNFVFFNRLDFVDNRSANTTTRNHTQKIIHNFHYSRLLDKDLQFGLHHGIKHIIAQIDQKELKTTIDTTSIEFRYDLSEKWDVGLRAGYLRDWTEKNTQGLAGISVGMTPTKNAWLELGYNFEGFDDQSFDDSNYKNQGPYLGFRYKFDQDTFKARK